MKLLSKTNIYTSAATFTLMLSGLVVIYFVVLGKISKEEDEHLLIEKKKIIEMLEEGQDVKYFNSPVGQQVNVTQIPKQTVFVDLFKTIEREEFEGDEEVDEFIFRELLFQVSVKDKCYEVIILRTLSEGREIWEYVALVVVIFLIVSFFLLFLLNRYISKIIWAPFYRMLYQLKNWNLKENKKIAVQQTNIDEFQELNKTVNSLIKKVQTDYYGLKEFTENISHETQTPVAVISAKLELLIQESGYSSKQQQLLAEAYQATLRLKKLNQTLVMLTRIEKGMYNKVEELDITHAIEEKLAELSEFLQAKEITVEKKLIPLKGMINPEMFNILINNLFVNAIKHNRSAGGVIRIALEKNQLTIENTGDDKKIAKEDLFDRITPYSTDKGSIGLGLSIIKKITEILGCSVEYKFNSPYHSFKITW